MRNTSAEAGASIAGSASTLREQIFEFLRKRGDHGATDEKIQIGLKMNPSTQRPRRLELFREYRIIDAGTMRKTISGRWAIVWTASTLARAVSALVS